MASFAQYAKEFDNPFRDCLIKPESVAKTEMIAPQLNDQFVEDLETYIGHIYNVVVNHGIKDVNTLFRNSNTRQAIVNLNRVIKERLGINTSFLIIDQPGCFFSCIPCPPKAYNSINRYVIKNYKNTKDYLKGNADFADPEEKERRNDELHVYEYGTSEKRLYMKYLENVNSITKAMKSDGVIVDLKKAKIHGLPDDYKVLVVADFVSAFTVFNLTIKEVVAVLLHELGHIFTHIEYSYRQVDATNVLLDTLNVNLRDKNKNYKDAIKIAYENATGKKLDEKFKKLNATTATVYVINNFDKDVVESRVHSYTDSEQLADQFCTQFGLGAELSSALTKLTKTQTNIFSYTRFYVYSQRAFLLFILAIGLICLSLGLGTGILISGAIGTILGFVIGYMWRYLFATRHTTSTMTYDEFNRRIHRVRNDVIRIIRTAELDKDTAEGLLDQIDFLTEEMNSAVSERRSLIDFLLVKFNKYHNDLHNVKTTERLMEDLQENNLHVAAAKLNTLK